MIKRLLITIRDELQAIRWKWLLIRSLMNLLPEPAGGRLRPILLRLAGIKIGGKGWIMGTPSLVGSADMYKKLTIGNGIQSNIGVHFDLRESITLGDNVGIGHYTMFLTTTHDMHEDDYQQYPSRLGAPISKPIVVENGAWLGARSLILPGIRIGTGAVVAAGAVVTKDVPPHTLVGGVPAKFIRMLRTGESPASVKTEQPIGSYTNGKA